MGLLIPSLHRPKNHPVNRDHPPFDATEPRKAAFAVSSIVACNRLGCHGAASLGVPWSHRDFPDTSRRQRPPLIRLLQKTKSHICCARSQRLWTSLARAESPAEV
jgi:hypothetical protein